MFKLLRMNNYYFIVGGSAAWAEIVRILQEKKIPFAWMKSDTEGAVSVPYEKIDEVIAAGFVPVVIGAECGRSDVKVLKNIGIMLTLLRLKLFPFGSMPLWQPAGRNLFWLMMRIVLTNLTIQPKSCGNYAAVVSVETKLTRFAPWIVKFGGLRGLKKLLRMSVFKSTLHRVKGCWSWQICRIPDIGRF